MPLINLNKISYTGVASESDYFIGAVVNSSSGPKEVTIIKNENDLDTYFPDIENRNGYVNLLNSNSNLVLKRIQRTGSKESTLRITNKPYLKYVYPEVYSDLSLYPKAEDISENEIILDNSLINKLYFQEELILNSFTSISGMIAGLFNYNGVQDRIYLYLNNETYISLIDEDGSFGFQVNEFDILNDEFTQFELELISTDYTNPSLEISTKHSQNYSIQGVNTLSLVIDKFPFIDNIIYKDSFISTTYPITGYLEGDFNVGDIINIYIGDNTYETECDYLGKFSVDIPVEVLLSNSRIEGIAETVVFNGGKAKSVMNYQSDNLEIDLESDSRYHDSYIEVQKYGNRTLVYDIDFNSSETVNQDYIIIPSGNRSHWNDNIFIYFLDESNPVQSPNLFVNNPVSLFSVSSPQFPVLIPSDPIARVNWQNNRAELVYNILTEGSYNSVPGEINFNGIDIGCNKELCILDKVNNKLRLVFNTPVNDISYYTSNSLTNKFSIKSNLNETYKLLTRYSRWDSIISFSSLIQGDIEVGIKIEHIKGYQYYITETYKEDYNVYQVSLDRDELDYNGNNIFAENVINGVSKYIKCIVHLKEYSLGGPSGGLATYNDKYFNKDTDTPVIEGSYLLAKGSEGDTISNNEEAYIEAVKDIFNSDNDINVFHADVFYEKFHLNILLPYLKENQTVCVTSIPDTILNDRSTEEINIGPLLDNFLLEKEDREYLIYCFGHCRVDEKYTIPSSFYTLNKLITGDFAGPVEDNIVMSYLKKGEKDILTKKYINYMEESNGLYNVTYISNLPEYLDPIYLLSATYTKQYFTRFLRSKLGMYPMDLYFKLKSKISSVKSYTSLISLLKIKLFEVEGNDLKVILELELSGLINKTLSLTINLKAN